MIVISGASASGKTEVAKILYKKYGISRSITVTTREKRVGEVNGVDYFFVDKKEFQRMIKNDELVEYTEYNNNFYGSRKDQIRSDKCIVIEKNGLEAYLKVKGDDVVTFVLIADESLRYNRMISRGDKIEDADKRIVSDRIVFDEHTLPKVDYIINNGNQTLEETADEIYQKYQEHIKK